MSLTQAREHVKHRVAELPDTALDCEGCDSEDAMRIRRSSLRDEPCADDLMLKCQYCWRIRTHGIPITRDRYETELDWRTGRTLDMVVDGPETVEENLDALGYIEY